MITLNTLLEDIKDVPENRLEELHQFVQTLTTKSNHSEANRKRILSFGGAFSDMSTEDYADFLIQTKNTRTTLFDRNIEL
jgi:hypothetical protein